MSTSPENELDLEKLFLPAWAQEPPSAKHYARHEEVEELPGRKEERRGRRPFRREESRPRGDRRDRPRGPDERRRPFEKGKASPYPREPREPRDRRELPPPLVEVNVSFVPDERGVESLARQIKTTGRAYPLFDIARLILQKPERYAVTLSVKKKPDGQPVQPLFACALDETLWLSEDEAVAHVLKHHQATFYQTERTATEPPKGKYTFVAQCGLSGVILGPPNHHDYQNQLRKLHAERFSRMPFETFKSRVKIVRDEAVVKQWVEEQSWKTEYVCLNMPEPLRLPTRESVERHFREVHKDNIIKAVDSHTLGGVPARRLGSPELARLVRHTWEGQKRFPLQMATVLSQQFASHGLQFFKVNKTFTHVSVARPHFLDLETTPVSAGVKRIVDFINATPKCTRRNLLEALAPTGPALHPPAGATAEGEKPPAGGTPDANPPQAAEPAAPPAESAGPSPEQTAVIADLHWLIHQGHVIEFANGVLETAKKPLPKPPKPEVKPAEQTAEEAPTGESAATMEAGAESDANLDPEMVSAEPVSPDSPSSPLAASVEPAVPAENVVPPETPPAAPPPEA